METVRRWRKSEDEKVRREEMQVREKVGKSRNTVFFQCLVAPEGCVQVAQLDYATKLARSMPEVYFIERRKAKYHFGYESLGCTKASHLTAAPLRNGVGLCLRINDGDDGDGLSVNEWTVGMSASCRERWFLNSAGRIVAERFASQCLSIKRDKPTNRFKLHIHNCSELEFKCDDGSVCKEHWRFFFDTTGLLRNRFLEARKQEGDTICLSSDPDTPAARPYFVAGCNAATDLTSWYFDGGDCLFGQYVSSAMQSPLQWRYVLGENGGAVLGTETETEVEQRLEIVKQEISRYAFGSCQMSLAAAVQKLGPDNLAATLSLKDAEGDKPVDEKYIPAIHVGSSTSTAFTCLVGGETGSKVMVSLKQKQESLENEIKRMEEDCSEVQLDEGEAPEFPDVGHCKDGCQLGDKRKVLSGVRSEYDWDGHTRKFSFRSSTLSKQDQEAGVKFGQADADPSPNPFGCCDKGEKTLKCGGADYAISRLFRSKEIWEDRARWDRACIQVTGLRANNPVVVDSIIYVPEGSDFFKVQELYPQKGKFIVEVHLGRVRSDPVSIFDGGGFRTDRIWSFKLAKFCRNRTNEIVDKKAALTAVIAAIQAGASGLLRRQTFNVLH
eukprot:s804_g1.t1